MMIGAKRQKYLFMMRTLEIYRGRSNVCEAAGEAVQHQLAPSFRPPSFNDEAGNLLPTISDLSITPCICDDH